MAEYRVLLVEDDEDDFRLTSELLAESGDDNFEVVRAPTYESAILQIRLGGWDVFLVDYCLGRRSGLDLLCGELREGALGPVIILTGQDAREVDVEAMKHGAAGYLLKRELLSKNLARTLRYAIEAHAAKTKSDSPADASGARPSKRGRTVALVGAKGGAGTTTVVANVGAALSGRGLSVAALEMRGDRGNLTDLLNIAPTGDIGSLMAKEPSEIGASRLEACLTRHASGLRVLAAPQSAWDCRDLDADHAAAILDAAVQTSDLVLVDLPSNACAANREVLCRVDLVAMVIEREFSSIAAARAMLSLFHAWQVSSPIGSIVVSRVALPDAMAANDINARLDLKRYGVVPPAPEVFHKCALAGTPVALAHPSHPSGRALDELALFLLLVR